MNEHSENSGLDTIERFYSDRGGRVSALRSQVKKIIGYFCCAPIELITAAGLIPYRIMGDMKKPTTRADAYLETIMCPFVRSSFDLALQGAYDFLDGFVVPHGCDNTEKIYEIWSYNFKPSYSRFINVPHTTSLASLEFCEAEFNAFKRSLERFSNQHITHEGLTRAIALHNRNRSLIRELYALRKPDPPLLSGAEMMKISVVNKRLPVEESNLLLERIIQEIKARDNGPQKRPVRMMIYSSELDDPMIIQMIEDLGANVVVDDMCMGLRAYAHDVVITHEPIQGLVAHYLKEITCPRTWSERTGTRQEELDERFGHLKAFAEEWRVNAALVFIIRYCDNHSFDVPDVMDYLQGLGLETLHVESDYSMSGSGQLKTKVQAFIEMIG